MKLALYIDKNSAAALHVYNFHPSCVYTVLPLLEKYPDLLSINSNSREIVDMFSLYDIPCQLIGSENEMQKNEETLFIDGSYPLIEISTWEKIIADFEKGSTHKVPFVYSGIPAEQTGLSLKNTELLSSENPVDVILIDAFIKSDFFKTRPVKKSSGYLIKQGAKNGKPRLLFSAPYAFFPEALIAGIEQDYEITYAFNAPYNITKELLKDCEIWLTGTCPPYYIDSKIITSGKKLRIIATPSTGTNHLDIKAASENGIKVCSIKTADFLKNIHASSEHTFALLLAMIKKIPMVTHASRYGTWREQEHVFRSIEIHGKTIGIIGYGRIGGNLARYCHTFGMNVLAFDPFKSINDGFTEQVNSLQELLAKSDIVSLNYHLTSENHQSFKESDFAAMKQGSYFLNTARGELVDEHALIHALESGKLKAAAVDVISNEADQDKWNHPLIAYARMHENLIISPHTAGLTVDSESKAAIEIFREIEKELKA